MINLNLSKGTDLTQCAQDAIDYIKNNKGKLISRFADIHKYPSHEKPFTIFMAGAPGAGKTEFSKAIINELIETKNEDPIVRLDIDEVRDFLPSNIYTGKNSSEVQRAASLGVEKLFDYTHHTGQNVILDSTLANYKKAKDDIQRAIRKGRRVGIMYVYQEPQTAWQFTKKREKLEGRYVPKEVFIESFLNSKKNAQMLKDEFGEQIELHLIIKDIDNVTIRRSEFNVTHLDGYLDKKYTIGQLQEIIK